MAKSKAQKALASGPSKIGAKARAVASKLKEKASAKHGKEDLTATKKNSKGSIDAPSTGKHSKESGYQPKHAAKATPKSVSKNAASNSHTPSIGKHSKEVADRKASKVAGMKAKEFGEKANRKKVLSGK
jgi:hypothetical protein